MKFLVAVVGECCEAPHIKIVAVAMKGTGTDLPGQVVTRFLEGDPYGFTVGDCLCLDLDPDCSLPSTWTDYQISAKRAKELARLIRKEAKVRA